MDGKPVRHSDDVIATLGYEVGKKFEIEVRRDPKEKKTLYVTPESSPSVAF